MGPIAEYRRVSRVAWRDTDASGYAHCTAFIRMMEETEYSFLRSRGLSVMLQDSGGTIGFPRLSAQLSIDQPIRFDAEVETRLRLVDMDGNQFVYEFELFDRQDVQIGTGQFRVAACRFPPGRQPYAILTPQHVMAALR